MAIRVVMMIAIVMVIRDTRDHGMIAGPRMKDEGYPYPYPYPYPYSHLPTGVGGTKQVAVSFLCRHSAPVAPIPS